MYERLKRIRRSKKSGNDSTGQRSVTRLETALSAVNVHSLEPLPFAHVTFGRWLTTIVEARELKPRHCGVMSDSVLYFSYGAPYYRSESYQTEDVLEFPVVFIFDVDLSMEINRYYPFDTGGLVAGVFGGKWRRLFQPLTEFYVTERPDRLVSCFYASNEQYLQGKVQIGVPTVPPLPQVHAFLSKNLSGIGADQRQRTIECLALQPVNLLERLRWVAYPNSLSHLVRRLWEACPKKFQFHGYQPDVNDNPSALVTYLSRIMKKEFQHLYLPPV